MQVLKGSFVLLVIVASTVVLTLILCSFALAKFLAPEGAVKDRVRSLLAGIAELWISVNNALLSLYRDMNWDVEIPSDLDRQGCYLVNSNHRSWVDILVLQRCFNRKIPLLRFFLKKELFWVPFLGIAWWALDFPFMLRASREKLSRRPGLKGKDLDTARKACEKFRHVPVSMMNFPEGTRFSRAKAEAFGSPYRNLLSPRIGGIGQVLYALGEPLDALIDVAIVYPGKHKDSPPPTFWQLVSGQVPRITVRARQREVPMKLRGRNFRTDRDFRHELEAWVNRSWLEKDTLISELCDPSAS